MGVSSMEPGCVGQQHGAPVTVVAFVKQPKLRFTSRLADDDFLELTQNPTLSNALSGAIGFPLI